MKAERVKLLTYLKGYRFRAAVSPFFKFLEAAFELIVPLALSELIDKGVNGADASYILKDGLIMLALALTGFLCSLVCQYNATVAALGYGSRLRSALYRKITMQPLADTAGEDAKLINEITSDVNNSQNAVGLFLRLVTRSPFLAAGGIVMAFLISPRLSLIFLGAVLLTAAAVYLILKFSLPRYRAVTVKLDASARLVKEELEGARSVRAYNRERQAERAYRAADAAFVKEAVRVNNLSVLSGPVSFLFINLAAALVVYAGGFSARTPSVSAGELVALTNYLTQILLSLLVIATVIPGFMRAKASNDRIRETLAREDEDMNTGGLTAFPDGAENAAVEFDGVSFGYGGGKDIISDFNLSVKRGERVAVTGATGSGKSTLLNLLPRFFTPRGGTVKLFGACSSEYSAEFLRRGVRIAPAVPVIFSASVADNLRLGKRDASEDEMRSALAAARADFVTDLSAPLLAGGKNLSTGQKQRISLARIFLSRPEILILDDALSALDNVTMREVWENVKKEFADKTVFIVTRNPIILKECGKSVCLNS